MDPDVILPRVKDLLDDKTYSDLERILRFRCPAHYNVHGSRENHEKYREYKNHTSLAENELRAKSALNKEDKREFVLTFPAWMTDLILDLHVNPQVLVMIPGKKDHLVFDSSFMVDKDSHPYNADCDSELEPDIFFGSAWVRHLTYIYNLCISFPNEKSSLRTMTSHQPSDRSSTTRISSQQKHLSSARGSSYAPARTLEIYRAQQTFSRLQRRKRH